MKTRIIDGVEYEVVPEEINYSCKGCYFDELDLEICKRGSFYAQEYSCRGNKIIYKQIKNKIMEFKKSDLRTGMRVKTSGGKTYFVMLNYKCNSLAEEIDVFVSECGWSNINSYNNDLTFCGEKSFDIVKVEIPKTIIHVFSNENWKTIWERTEVLEVTLKQVAEKFEVNEVKIKE